MPVTVTHYEYDADGRMVRSIAATESRFTKAEVALLLMSRRSERERDENGFLWSEVTDPENKDAFTGPENPTVNFATKNLLDRQQAYYKKHDKPNSPVNRNGHTWRVVKKPIQ